MKDVRTSHDSVLIFYFLPGGSACLFHAWLYKIIPLISWYLQIYLVMSFSLKEIAVWSAYQQVQGGVILEYKSAFMFLGFLYCIGYA